MNKQLFSNPYTNTSCKKLFRLKLLHALLKLNAIFPLNMFCKNWIQHFFELTSNTEDAGNKWWKKKKADHIRKYYKVENIKTRVTSCDASIMFIIRIKIDLVQVNFSDVDDLFPKFECTMPHHVYVVLRV